jgi:hypothetical protein
MNGIRARLNIVLLFALLSLALPCFVYCQKAGQPADEPYAGEFAGWQVKVPLNNYYFVRSVLNVFGTRWGATPQNEKEIEERIWEQLVLSFEAFKRGIKVETPEVEEEVGKILKDEKVGFDWKKDPAAYEKWVKEKTHEPVNFFQNQLTHLIQLEKLRKQVLESVKPAVSEDEARDEYINEYNTMELELVQFDELKDAQDYYKKMRDPALWDKQAQKDPKFFKRPGFVSFEFLINMWIIPKADLYKMLKMEVNSIYPPTPIYKGYGVFRIIKKREADPAEFPKLRDSYFKQVENIKKYEGLNNWVKKLKEEARIVIYPKPEPAAKGK